jgi:ribosomal protein S8
MSFVNAPIHDMLIRIKNSYMARREQVQKVVYSKFKEEILKLLKRYSFIKSYEIQEDIGNKKYLKILLNRVIDPINDIPVVKFYSKPSRPWYVSYENIKSVA